MENLDWLAKLVSSFPETPTRRKNLIEIAGYPSWENVNSNLLAFYFDEQEEHGFGRLFFSSLLDVLSDEFSEFDRNDFEAEDPVTAEREVFIQGGGRIDLLVKPTSTEEQETAEQSDDSSWAILIENKLYHHLANSLKDYWDSVNAEHKFGIVLSLHPVSAKDMKEKTLADPGVLFKNITHRQLAAQVKKNLPEYFEQADDRHLLFLKDYLANIETHYMSNTEHLDQTLALFHQKQEKIKELKDQDVRLLEFISETVFDIFRANNIYPGSDKKTSQAKHFYFPDEEDELHRAFRFYVILGEIRYQSQFECYFELYRKSNTRYGGIVRHLLEEKGTYTAKKVRPGTGGSETASYMHIYTIQISLAGFEEKGFRETLKEKLNTHFFNHPNNFIEAACDALAQAKQQQQS